MRKTITIAVALLMLFSCTREKTAQPFAVIPYPAEVEFSSGIFDLVKARFTMEEQVSDSAAAYIGKFADELSTVSGRKIKLSRGTADKGVIFKTDNTIKKEGYTIDVTPEALNVAASSYSGFVYAIQTIRQMLPAEIYGGKRAKADYVVPCVHISDSPRFSYRGVLIDVGRHFYDVDEIKKCLDIMSVYKENVLHWHLTEDQGWRFESKKYPRLTEVGSIRHGSQIDYNPEHLRPEDHGGFYTQDQMRDVVAYAAERGINVIPEIDLPGHMLSALASYPELGCTGGPYEVANTWGVKKDILCAGQEKTFKFLEDILTEVMDIFPSEYINIGGDEVPKDRWNNCPRCKAKMKELGLHDHDGYTAAQYLQNYVMARIQKFLAEHGRKIIGWNEILEGDMDKSATVMVWRSLGGQTDSKIWEYNSIMSPTSYMYIDRYQSYEHDKEPFSIGAYLPVEMVYEYEPYKGAPAYGKDKILGVQANLWTEYINTPEYLEYMLLPRLAAVSEVQWCTTENRQYPRFRLAMDRHRAIYEQKGLVYAKHLWGQIGLPGNEQPARTPEELAKYMENE